MRSGKEGGGGRVCVWQGRDAKDTSPVSKSRHVMISNSLRLPVGGIDIPAGRTQRLVSRRYLVATTWISLGG